MVTTQRRNTAQRAAIVAMLEETGEFVTAQDLHSALRNTGSGIGLATVYRTLQDLAGTGELDTVRKESGEVLYRQCAQPSHHHHLVCRSCGRTEEVKAPGVERWAKSVAEQYGFVELDHQVELFGLCQDCARSRAS
ncbi:Fur family transcriptional regulator [Nakamurella leprariae]|uniref:Transcriptional repressor n=1 Tax=Nakamurella leprariae TaxID=2803911 RepID=A0A938YF90_9ACTN|nr:transcriptional repressor [Nakamurella leprariae]MBM9468456.1 transcriptional repressor [Nakamurella leprariae]